MTGEHRLALAATLASLLAGLTLVPLIDGPAWLVGMIVIVVVLAGTGAAARQLIRWWPVVLAVQVLAGLLAVTALFVRDAAVLGVFPGPAAWGALADLVRAGLTVTREELPPVPAGRGLLLLATLGVALVALVVDVVAVALRKPAVAGLPLLAVYCVPAAVLPDGLDWWWFAVAALGFLLLVGADSDDRVHQWGRVLGPATAAEGDRALGGLLAGGRRLVAGSVIAAVLVPAAIPGLDSRLFGDHGEETGQGRGGNITVINPILRIRENLVQRDDVVVLRYRPTATTDPEPLRIVSDDAFDGKQWSPSVGRIPRSNRVQDGLPTAPGLSGAVSTAALRTEFQTLDLRQTYLPLPYPTTKVDIDGPWLFDAVNLNVVGDQVTTRNLRYTAQHLALTPTADQLKAAPAPPAAIADTYARMPANTPREIRDRSRKVAGTGSAYDKAMALQQWFRSDGGFRYSTTVLPPPGKDASSQDAVVAFLRSKQGYCVQFASAMAAMARTLGIPSRVGVGFLPGDRQSDGSWAISVHDAHAWPELYFSTVGWVRFEPTPGARSGPAPEWAVPPGAEPEQATPTPTASATPQAPRAAPREEPQPPEPAAGAGPSRWQRILDAVPWRLVWIVLLLAALGTIPLVVTHVLRRLRSQRVAHRSPGVRVEAAWDELRERLEDLGVRWAASWTPRALQVRLVDDHELGGTERAALGRLVTDVEQERYAPPGAPVREIPELRGDVDVIARGVAQSAAVPTWSRRRARWFPTSGLRALGAAARRGDVAADEARSRNEARSRAGGGVGSSVRRLVGRR